MKSLKTRHAVGYFTQFHLTSLGLIDIFATSSQSQDKTNLIHSSLDDVDETQQDCMETEEDIISTDRVYSIWVPLQKLLLQGSDTAA